MKRGIGRRSFRLFRYVSEAFYDGGPDGRGVGFYFRNVTEPVLFGVRGALRTRQAGRRQVNIILERTREHSRKPERSYDIR